MNSAMPDMSGATPPWCGTPTPAPGGADTSSMPDAVEVMSQAGQENFPVALRVLPRATRRHLKAIYGFARLCDDIGDETPGDRLGQLTMLATDLERVYTGWPQHPLLRRLQPSVRELNLPPGPFRRLIEANRQDQRVTRYQTFDELMGYCELSANPVGHLVLHVFGVATPERMRLSDSVCSALQLIEHVQDVAEDMAAGRVYLPQHDLARFGCGDADLRALTASVPVRALVEFEVGRARELLDEGAVLVGSLQGYARLTVAGCVAGGRAALTAIAAADYDVLPGAPAPRKSRMTAGLLTTLLRKG